MNHPSKSQHREEGVIKVGKCCTLATKRRVRPRAWSKKSQHHAEERRVPRREREHTDCPHGKRREHERVNGYKDSPGGTLRSLKSEMEKKIGRKSAIY